MLKKSMITAFEKYQTIRIIYPPGLRLKVILESLNHRILISQSTLFYFMLLCIMTSNLVRSGISILASVLRVNPSLGIRYVARSDTSKQWWPRHLAAQIILGVPRLFVEVSTSNHLQIARDLVDASGRLPAW